MKLNGRPEHANWREYPDAEPGALRVEPSVAARDAIRAGNHVDAADAYLLQAAFESGAAERANDLKAADICATLAMRDAIGQLEATIKHATVRLTESNADVVAHLKAVA